MPEAVFEDWQVKKDGSEESLLSLAREKKINIISSSALASGTMLEVPLPTEIYKCKNLGAKHI